MNWLFQHDPIVRSLPLLSCCVLVVVVCLCVCVCVCVCVFGAACPPRLADLPFLDQVDWLIISLVFTRQHPTSTDKRNFTLLRQVGRSCVRLPAAVQRPVARGHGSVQPCGTGSTLAHP